MGNLKTLASDTVIYGLSTILGRLLNFLLMPLYLREMPEYQNGIITYVYSIIAIVQVLLSFGFETSFFRFAKDNPVNKVFSTLFLFVLNFGLLFVFSAFVLKDSFSSWTGIFPSSIFVLSALILFVDSIVNLPFALQRLQNKRVKYALNRLLQVVVTVLFNLFFLYVLPYHKESFKWLTYFGVSLDNMVYNIFYANLVGCVVVLIFLFKTTINQLVGFDKNLLFKVFRYSWPILLVGFFGMINLHIDKLLLPKLLVSDDGYSDLGVYGNNFKIGALMAIFTQSFRMAFEPFFFKHSSVSKVSIYARVLEYYVAFGIFIFLVIMVFDDLVNLLLTNAYSAGNVIIPFVLLGQLFFGISYNLSLWYKLTDKTIYGLYFAVIGSVITVILNIILVPTIGIVGAAIASSVSYFVIMVLSFYFGQRHYFVPYNLFKLSILFIVGLILLGFYFIVPIDHFVIQLFYSSLLVLLYVIFVWFYLKPLKASNN